MASLVDELPEGAVLIAQIEIVRFLTEDQDLITWYGTDAAGDDLPLVEALGMLRLTEDTAIREAMGEGGIGPLNPDEDDEGDGEE